MTNHLSSLSFNGIAVSVQDTGDESVLRFEWSNGGARKDNPLILFYIVFWLMFSIATVYITVMLVTSKLSGEATTTIGFFFQLLCMGLWLVGGWTVTFGIPYHFRTLTCREWIEVSPRSVAFGTTGPWFPPESESIPIGHVVELFLGHDGKGSDGESFLTLNVYHRSSDDQTLSREELGTWLAPDLKASVFAAIKQFVSANHIHLPTRTDRPLKEYQR
jgi:hypothetical protein